MLERVCRSPRPSRPAPSADEAFGARVGRLAIRSLYREVAIDGKPGLVGPSGSGSHPDMNFATFLRSLQALRGYFPAIAACGLRRPDFVPLQRLGIDAEASMLAATGGVNTHRGAIFNLGLLCAALGVLRADGAAPDVDAACAVVGQHWGAAIREGLTAAQAASTPLSHGLFVARRDGSGGARQEAASGFPAARCIG